MSNSSTTRREYVEMKPQTDLESNTIHQEPIWIPDQSTTQARTHNRHTFYVGLFDPRLIRLNQEKTRFSSTTGRPPHWGAYHCGKPPFRVCTPVALADPVFMGVRTLRLSRFSSAKSSFRSWIWRNYRKYEYNPCCYLHLLTTEIQGLIQLKLNKSIEIYSVRKQMNKNGSH